MLMFKRVKCILASRVVSSQNGGPRERELEPKWRLACTTCGYVKLNMGFIYVAVWIWNCSWWCEKHYSRSIV